MAAIRRFEHAVAVRVMAAMALVVALVATMSLATAAQVAAADPTATMQMAKTAQVDGELTPGTIPLHHHRRVFLGRRGRL